jgi:hypothetical protein
MKDEEFRSKYKLNNYTRSQIKKLKKQVKRTNEEVMFIVDGRLVVKSRIVDGRPRRGKSF